MGQEKNKVQGTSLTVRLTLPTIFVIAITLTAVLLFGSKLNESLYNHQTIETLKNNLQLTQKALNEGWQHTKGAAIRTESVLKEYTTQVLAGRLDFIGFQEQSGVMIVDSYSGGNIQSYPAGRTALIQSDIQNIIKISSSNYIVNDLKNGGFAISTYFAPLGLHLIAYNKKGFAQTDTKENQQILLISIFLTTAILLVSMMLIVIHVSITRPLRTIQENMDNMIQKDDYASSLDIEEASKEVQALGKHFNTLISHIDTRDKQIHRHANNLESTVKERTDELKEAQSQLVLNERLAAIGEFASSVAHELRNPLASIKMGVEKISEIESLEGNNKRRLTLIQKEVHRLSEMLKGILAFAAPNPTKLGTINVNKFIKELKPILVDLAAVEGLTLNVEKVPTTLKITADNDKLKQTFINVIKNACEAAPKETEINVSVSAKNKQAEIVIINSGEPIPKAAEKRLFEPFFTTKPSGTGLGLPTTKRIMNEMGGDIALKNAKNNTIQTTLFLKKA